MFGRLVTSAGDRMGTAVFGAGGIPACRSGRAACRPEKKLTRLGTLELFCTAGGRGVLAAGLEATALRQPRWLTLHGQTGGNELGEPWFGGRMKIIFPPAPFKGEASGMKGVVGQDELFALGSGEPAFDKGEIQIRFATINFVADDGMAEVGEMEAELMFAAGERLEAQKGKGRKRKAESGKRKTDVRCTGRGGR